MQWTQDMWTSKITQTFLQLYNTIGKLYDNLKRLKDCNEEPMVKCIATGN